MFSADWRVSVSLSSFLWLSALAASNLQPKDRSRCPHKTRSWIVWCFRLFLPQWNKSLPRGFTLNILALSWPSTFARKEEETNTGNLAVMVLYLPLNGKKSQSCNCDYFLFKLSLGSHIPCGPGSFLVSLSVPSKSPSWDLFHLLILLN